MISQTFINYLVILIAVLLVIIIIFEARKWYQGVIGKGINIGAQNTINSIITTAKQKKEFKVANQTESITLQLINKAEQNKKPNKK